MREKISRLVFTFLVMAVVLFQFAFMSKASTELSNTLICWGLRRVENHEQPVLDSDSLVILNKYNGISMGNKDKNYVYLTFDLGYEAGYTSTILDALKENNVKAAFFITGHYLNTQTDLVKRMIEEGHIVGNHTVNHKSLSNLSDEEIKNEVMTLHNALYEKLGYEMTYFRPPKGEFSERVLDVVTKLNYKTALWSFAYDDWDENKQGREEYGKRKILDNLHNGDVLLLHATSKDNAAILDSTIKETIKMGYEFKSLDDFEY
ncbi:MAG: polysaccharide deacetylase family protein [Clostridia bacterium]|nr:polysaccharide deacetylase family protein [Clostridia bacterium]